MSKHEVIKYKFTRSNLQPHIIFTFYLCEFSSFSYTWFVYNVV